MTGNGVPFAQTQSQQPSMPPPSQQQQQQPPPGTPAFKTFVFEDGPEIAERINSAINGWLKQLTRGQGHQPTFTGVKLFGNKLVYDFTYLSTDEIKRR